LDNSNNNTSFLNLISYLGTIPPSPLERAGLRLPTLIPSFSVDSFLLYHDNRIIVKPYLCKIKKKELIPLNYSTIF
jgi:hypothetical protein